MMRALGKGTEAVEDDVVMILILVYSSLEMQSQREGNGDKECGVVWKGQLKLRDEGRGGSDVVTDLVHHEALMIR
jgi:hypothetical protein